MTVKLRHIEDVKTSEEYPYQVRALEINRRSLALDAIAKWKKDHRKEYKKIITTINLLAKNGRISDPNRVKKSRKYPTSYEMKAKRCSARLYFFYMDGNEEIIVCTNGQWKSKPSKNEQDRAFKMCNDLRKTYHKEIERKSKV